MQANNIKDKEDNGINLVDLFMYMVARWKWFLLSVAVFGGLAWLIYARQPFVYFSSATVIIKDPSNKTYSAGFDRYDNFINRVNVENEILQFRSKKLFREVIRRVNADVSYKVEDGLRKQELYTRTPLIVSFIDVSPAIRSSFRMTLATDDSVIVTVPEGKDLERRFKAAVDDTTGIAPGINVVISRTNWYGPSWTGKDIYVEKIPLESMVGYYRANFNIRQEGEESSILNLSMRDASPARARDMLNTLITVYNEEAINDKNQIAVNTADFINERIIIIEKELGSVETDLESFKKTNEIVDISSTSGMYMQESQKYNTDVLELQTQLELAYYIKDYLTDPSKEVDLIPANTGISDMRIETQINQYNTIKLRRDKLIDDSSEMNPVVQELNNSLNAMKQTIIRAVDNLIVSLNLRLDDARSREERAKARMTSIPTKEREMLSIERQQKIKESLYMFLLNRREENALSQAMADNNARIIDEADGSMSPIAPNRNRIIILGMLIGLVVPGLYFLLVLFLDTRIRTRKDIDDVVDLPVLGEIPLDKARKKSSRHSLHTPAVSERSRAVISEAFRILRTNMSFMTKGGSTSSQVIMLTSFNEGAGKTFTSYNLAFSMLYTKKKVLLVDLDIRKGSLSKYVGKGHAGVTDYLANTAIKTEDILHVSQDGSSPDIIKAGTIAPNPTELLMGHRLDDLFEELRKRYDYIIVDSVPVGIIADAFVSNRIADLTIFMVRSGKLDRRLLPEIEKMYREKRLVNMALVLNGVDLDHRGYGYGYSYGYGYGYGYGGYGYGTYGSSHESGHHRHDTISREIRSRLKSLIRKKKD